MSKKKKATGRPKVITPDVMEKLVNVLRFDATDAEACRHAGISEAVFYLHLREDPVFRKKIREAQNFSFILMKQTVAKAVAKGDGKLALKWLKARQRDRYYEKSMQIDEKKNAFEGVFNSLFGTPKEDGTEDGIDD